MNTLIDKVQSPPAVVIADLVRQLERSGKKISKMQTGEPCFSTPQYIKEALLEAVNKNKTQYAASQGIVELRLALSKWYLDELQADVSPETILVTQGAIGGIYCVINAILNPLDEVIVVDPAWPQYESIITLNHGVPVHVSTRKSNGRLIASHLENVITEKTRLIIINNPCNPTGIVYNLAEINSFIEIAKKHNIYIMFDEVYNRLLYTDLFCSVLKCSGYKSYKERIIYINSFSKTFAMTGWRIGYAFLGQELLKKTLLVSQNIFTNISTFSQYAAVVAIEDVASNLNVFESMKVVYKQRRTELSEILTTKGIDFMVPEGAFYFFIKVNKDSLRFAEELLKEEKIAVVPGKSYGKDFNDYYRISFAVDNESYNSYVKWLKNYKP